MKTKAQFLLLLISISFFSCNGTVKMPATPISNIDTDFPATEKLEFKLFNKYDILKSGTCVIDDSTLWFFDFAETEIGSCYNLNTGKKLSIIASIGRAANELTELDSFEIIGDSVLLYTGRNTIKTFAKKDIIDNIPMGDRKFSIATVPDSILMNRMTRLPNGSILATTLPALSKLEKARMSGFNQKTIVIFNNKEANFYETINYESFDIEEADTELPANDLIKCAYSYGSVEIKDNDTVVFSVCNQFILYTFDIKSGNVVNEKRYTKMQRDGREGSLTTTNDRKLRVGVMKSCDKYVLCDVQGYFSEDDKDSKLYKEAIFVFDWELNPIKKFDLPQKENGYYTISNDCKSAYFCEFNEDGLVLYKADLNI